jgi:hypothetical protein
VAGNAFDIKSASNTLLRFYRVDPDANAIIAWELLVPARAP